VNQQDLETDQELIEFCTGPLSMFYLPVRTYYQSGPDDVPLKYLPDGNTKFGLVEIEDGLVDEVPSSVLTYTLYIDDEVVWKYRLSVPLAPTSEKQGAAEGAEGASSSRALFQPGEVLVDNSVEKWVDIVTDWVLRWTGLRVEHPAKDWIV
jgi:alkaline phosphatase D